MHRPEFVGHYKKLHKGTVVLGLTHRPVDPACELTVWWAGDWVCGLACRPGLGIGAPV